MHVPFHDKMNRDGQCRLKNNLLLGVEEFIETIEQRDELGKSSKDLDTVVVGVTNDDSTSTINGDSLREQVLTGALAHRPKRSEIVSYLIKDLDPVIASVDHQNVSVLIDNRLTAK